MLSVIEERDLLAKAFRDVCDELGCEYDNEEALIAAHDLKQRAVGWQPIETAPKDRPILAYCNHEVDPWDAGETTDGRAILTLYAAHAEGMGHAPTGFHIVEWGGAFDDSTWEYPNGAHLPDWWFVAGSEFEVAANPTHWMPLPRPPA